MKKVILVGFVLLSVTAQAQITNLEVSKETVIGKVKIALTKYNELSYKVDSEGDTVYIFSYRDKTYKSIEVWDNIYFQGGAQVLQDLYNTLIATLEADKNTEKSFKLGETNVSVISKRSLGTQYLMIYPTKKSGSIGVTDLTKAQLDKLFGKG